MRNPPKRLFESLEVRTLFSAAPSPSPLAFVPAGYSVDGKGNNADNPLWGSAGAQLLRTAAAQYANGLSDPAGANRPSAREISNTLADQHGEDVISDRLLSALVYAWGQFIDHDLDLTPNASPAQPFNVDVPDGDTSFDPNGVIPLNRSAYDPATGTTNARQQINVLTAWLDGSMIYGSDATTASALRTFAGGLMKMSADGLLPLNNLTDLPGGTLGMANDAHRVPNDQLFAAGDVRANENIELTALQTLFVREHNYWARKISAANPRFTDEQVFQRARAIVIGELQAITFNQWLSAVLGRNALEAYDGYDPTVNPGIANEFSTAAFRFGHSLLGDDVEFLDNRGVPVGEEVSLAEAFFNPDLVHEFGIAPVLKYLASDPASELDPMVVDSVRNFLFGPPGSGGLDLASLNIQRGREHGLADFNSTRVAYGLPKLTSFAQITADTEVQAKLQQLYGSVDNIDLWVGALAEDHVRGASVGPTLRAIISDQFERLRDGDRFWYQNKFSGRLLQQIDNTTLADVISRNTDLTNLQGNVFFFKASISGSVVTKVNIGRQTVLRGVPGLTVELLNVEENEVVATTTTDARGNYSFDVADGVRTGKYQIRLTLPGTTPTTKLSRTIAISRGNVFVADIDFNLTPPSSPTNPGWPGNYPHPRPGRFA